MSGDTDVSDRRSTLPLPAWITDAYTVLSAHLSESDTPESHGQVLDIPHDQATNVLVATDELELTPEDADHTITRLLDRGYLYEVDDEHRITTPPA